MATAAKKKEETTAKKQPALHAVISGTYRNSKKEVLDFEDVEGHIPLVEREVATAAIIKRYAAMWIKNSGQKERLHSVREVFIDSLEPTTYAFTYAGKDIKQMSYEELQDLATAKELRAVPLFKKGGLRHARTLAYAAYSDKILGREIKHQEEDFNFADLPPLIVDAVVERNAAKTFSNEDIIDMEQESVTTSKPKFTRDELESLAHEKQITFNPAITDAKLYQKIFNG